MAHSSRNITHRSAKSGKYKPLTVGAIEKEVGYKTNITNKNLKVSSYFIREGFAPLGKALEKLEHNLAK